MALTLGQMTKIIHPAGGAGLRMTVRQPILEDSELVHTVMHSEPYKEGEDAKITAKRFTGEMQAKINNWLTGRRLSEANAERDAFMPLLQAELTLEAK